MDRPDDELHGEPGDTDGFYPLQHGVVLQLRVLVHHLQARHRVEGHPYGGHDDEHHGDVGDHVGGAGGLGVLHQVPDHLLEAAHAVVGENLRGVLLHLHTLPLHLLVDGGELPLVLLPAAALQDGVVDPPELEVRLEGQDTHLLVDVKFSCPVEVQD